MIVLFGNPNPQMQTSGVSIPAAHLNQSVTRVEFWDGIDDQEFVDRTLSTDNDRGLRDLARSLPADHRRFAVALHELGQVVDVHSPGSRPDWIASDDTLLAQAAAAYFGCPVEQLREEDGRQIAGPTALLTNGGRDGLHAQHLATSAQPAAFNYVGLTANSVAPAAADTTLTGEIATAGGGLIRGQATYAHTAGTNTSTLTKTFTANGSDTLPVTVAKVGVFNASTAGTLGYEDLLSSTATLSVSGDSVTVTFTLTAG